MSEPLRLPEGYGIVLKRADDSTVAAFEISAFGPEPDQIMKMAANDAEWLKQTGPEDLEG